MLYFIHKHGNILMAGFFGALFTLSYNIVGLNVFFGLLTVVFTVVYLIQKTSTFFVYKKLLSDYKTPAKTVEEVEAAQNKVAGSYIKTAKKSNVPTEIVAHFLNINFTPAIVAYATNKNATTENLNLIGEYLSNKNLFIERLENTYEEQIFINLFSNINVSPELLDFYAEELNTIMFFLTLPIIESIGVSENVDQATVQAYNDVFPNKEIYINFLVKIAKNSNVKEETLGRMIASNKEERVLNAAIVGLNKIQPKLLNLNKEQVVSIYADAYDRSK
jgi:hypothetical protein